MPDSTSVPSGCGKSTVLRCIAGLEDITSGELWIGGELVNEIPPAKRGIAMVFQSYALYPHMTVAENMAFGLKLAGFNPRRSRRRSIAPRRSCRSSTCWSASPKTLSGGQRQRVAIGRAIVRKPGVFLFDEPLSNLDAALRVQMRSSCRACTATQDHDDLRHPRPGRGDDAGQPHRGAEQTARSTGRHADGAVPPPVNQFVAGFIGSRR